MSISIADAMLSSVRTTVTLDPDVENLIRRRMEERGVSFKEALNGAIRDGAARPAADLAFTTTAVSLGEPAFDADRALAVAADLEDAELLRKLRRDA